jgi:hypothetical protein
MYLEPADLRVQRARGRAVLAQLLGQLGDDAPEPEQLLVWATPVDNCHAVLRLFVAVAVLARLYSVSLCGRDIRLF